MSIWRTRDIKIRKVILHSLPRDKPSPTFSEAAIPGDSDPRIFDYFRRHIENSLQDEDAITAKFRDIEGKSARICQGLLSAEGDLVSGSAILATSLHQFLKKRENIASGDLAVVLYSGREKGKKQDCLALLKLDPSIGFRRVIETSPGRQAFITLKVEEDMLPTTRERLQKGAFIRRLPKFELLVLDHQIRTGEGAVARFFMDFLEADNAWKAEDAAKELIRTRRTVLKKLRHLGPEKHGILDERLRLGLRGRKPDVTELTEGIQLAPEDEKKLEDMLDELPPQALRVPVKVMQEELAKEFVVYRGDLGLRVERPVRFPAERFAEEFDQKTGFTTITIITENWQVYGHRSRKPEEDVEISLKTA